MTRLPFDVTAAITQDFGSPHPRYTAWGLAGHNGIDFGLPNDTPLYAPTDFEVVEVMIDESGYGTYIKGRTPAGEDWLLAHMRIYHLPQPGEWVAEGALVGFSNNSGLSTGPHLHLGYRPQWWVRGWPYNGFDRPPLDGLKGSP